MDIPRDRQGKYEPEIVPKHTKDISRIEEQVLFLYSQGVSTRDIENTMEELYGIEVDSSRISRITDRILPVIKQWQIRPLENIYAHVLLDCIHYKVRDSGKVISKAVYIALGTDIDGYRDVDWANRISLVLDGSLRILKTSRSQRYTYILNRWTDWFYSSSKRDISKK